MCCWATVFRCNHVLFAKTKDTPTRAFCSPFKNRLERIHLRDHDLVGDTIRPHDCFNAVRECIRVSLDWNGQIHLDSGLWNRLDSIMMVHQLCIQRRDHWVILLQFACGKFILEQDLHVVHGRGPSKQNVVIPCTVYSVG